MPIVEGSNGVVVRPNHVYVIPPSQRVTIRKGALRLETANNVGETDRSMIQALLSPSLSDQHLERFKDPARAAATLRLSTREREILQLIAEGRAAFHRENIKRKLGLRSTAELTRHAIEQGLVG